MADIVEYWIQNKYVHLLPPIAKGRNNGSNTIIRLPHEDPRIEKIGALDHWLEAQHDDYLFLCWNIIRRYTEAEWAAAKLCYWYGRKLFEPSGEECGTIYDETQACDICGANAPMVGPLRLRANDHPPQV